MAEKAVGLKWSAAGLVQVPGLQEDAGSEGGKGVRTYFLFGRNGEDCPISYDICQNATIRAITIHGVISPLGA